MFTHNRMAVDLNGTWKFCPDPMQRCRRQKWWKNSPGQNQVFPCWDPAGLWKIQVPGTWKMQYPELRWYDGHAVYMKDFEVAEIPQDHEAFLVFDGVIYTAEIYLNQQLVAQHDWGYSAFAVRVTELVCRHNRLFVLVENLPKTERVPGEIHDWNNDGGIINPVKLIFVPRNYVENVKVATRLAGRNAEIDVQVMLGSRNPAAAEKVTVRIPELKLTGSVTATVGKPATAQFKVPLGKIDLWCPEKPKLYAIELATRHETVRDEVGFREIRTAGPEIMLNGKPIQLYGVCVHSDFPETGRSASAAGIEKMIQYARDLGVNFLRCAHYPYSEEFGRAMDKAGLLWWEEVPAYWLRNMDLESQTRLACGMMEETVRRDWNRASLIFWSVSNECCYRNPENFKDNNYPYWFKSVAMIRGLDPTRLISCAEAGNYSTVSKKWNPNRADEFDTGTEDEVWRPMHADEWFNLFDVLAGNMYFDQPDKAKALYRKYVEMLKPYGKPLMISEFGSMSLRNSTVPADQLGSEARHSAIVRSAYGAFRELPEIKAVTIWALVDTRVPLHWRWYNGGKAVYRYGLVDENWEKKSVFATVREEIAKWRKSFARKK